MTRGSTMLAVFRGTMYVRSLTVHPSVKPRGSHVRGGLTTSPSTPTNSWPGSWATSFAYQYEDLNATQAHNIPGRYVRGLHATPFFFK